MQTFRVLGGDIFGGNLATGLTRGAGGVTPLGEFLSLANSEHVDIVGIGDSNQVQNGLGWDHGWQYALSQRYPMYATGLISAMENSGNGNGVGYLYAYNNGNSVGVITGAPADLDKHLNPVGPHRYGYLDDAATYASFTGLQIEATCPIDVNANLRFRFHYGTFLTADGSGSVQFQVRRGDSPFTNIVSPTAFDPAAANAYGMTHADLIVPAATRNYPLGAAWQRPGTTMQGPGFFTYLHATNTDRSAGFGYSTLQYYGGGSLRAMLAEFQAADTATFSHFFSALRDRQLQSSKHICIVINSGLNDRNETEASLGPSPVLDGDSPEAFIDNLTGIIELIEGVWTTNGWSQDELFFVVMPSHPISDPDDSELVSYRAAVADFVETRTNTTWIDLSAKTNFAEMDANSWYLSGADRNHLSQAGYETLAVRALR